MAKNILQVENLSKMYRIGEVGSATLKDDVRNWVGKLTGRQSTNFDLVKTNARDESAENVNYVWALKDISFSMKPGEVLGVVGKNGAGKSTLLKLISRITSPSTGSIKLKGKIASLLEVGTGMNVEMTARENIYLNGAILGMNKSEISRKFDEIIDFAGCSMYVDTPIKRFSSGMRVRLGFAVAAFLEPDILIVDEVLAVGDADFQKRAVGKIKDVSQNSGRTVLFVSHNMASVKNICTRGIVLKQGNMVYEGSANEAVDYYMSEYKQLSENLLHKREDRQGGTKFRFTNINIKNSKDVRLNSIISGSSLKIEAEFEKQIPFEIANGFISFALLDKYENFISVFRSDEIGYVWNSPKTEMKGKVSLNIPHLYLRAENYYLRMLSYSGKPSPENILDIIDNVSTLEVLPNDFWNSGIINRPGNMSIIPSFIE